jgi:acetyltransferase-like isoleucine patch superfamily enzyme
VNIVQYDLLEVGNDVVFGSRSAVLTRTSHEVCKPAIFDDDLLEAGKYKRIELRSAVLTRSIHEACKPVIIEDGCMVADRCVLLPGTTLKRGSVLGSGSLTREDCTIPVGSVWIGCRDGMAVELQPEDMSFVNKDLVSPFGKAFYQHQSTYYVIPLWGIVGYNWLWSALCICYKSAPLILSLLIVNHLYQYFGGTSAPNLFITLLIVLMVLKIMFDVTALLIIIVMKWILIGRRKVGKYGWNNSSYCQRWQILLTIERISNGLKNLLQGSYYIVLYFRLLGAKIGTNVCLYPMGADPMMTEPELVTIGDQSSIDSASLVGHINTRGNFALNALSIGKQCTLKSSSRLLSGATMENNSIMLEHTLIMAGDILEKNTVKQGWPAYKEYSMQHYMKQTDLLLAKHL